MARKRMFSLLVVDTDEFLDMPSSTQSLYYHLGMRADDDGFVSSPRKIVKLVNCSDDDLKLLIAKGFIIPFDSGIIAIKHWKLNNDLKKDRYTPTIYLNEKSTLRVNKNRVYSIVGNNLETKWIQNGNKLDTQYSKDKNSIDKYSIDKSSIDKEIYVQPEVATPPELTPKKKTSRFLPPTEEEVKQYCLENGYTLDAQRFVDFYECKGWMVGKNKMKNWKAAVRTWARKDQGGVRDEPEPTNSIRLW
ncbi:DNA replication protein [Holdemanella biformis]|uniref:DNA replication protein n=1 Tax=Holdemanella biformis TaxID=1735 RepID=UPI003A8DB39D